MTINNKHTFILFIGLYAAYALIKTTWTTLPEFWLNTALALVGLMILLIVWHQSKQDEFLKRLSHQAYVVAFWVCFACLFVQTQRPEWTHAIEQILPLWAIPLLAWQLVYVTIRFKNR